MLEKGNDSSFLRRPLSDEEQRFIYIGRVIELAEALHCLRTVPGLSQHVETARANTMNGQQLETVWFEFFVPYLIQGRGHKVVEFIVTDELKRPDIMVNFYGQLASVEIKAKLEGVRYTRQTLQRSINNACQQLPASGPGVIFLLIHAHWLTNAQFIKQAESVIEKALLNHRNCNAIFVNWPANIKLPGDGYAITWRFQYFPASAPATPLQRVAEFVIPKPMPVTSLRASFMFD